MVEISETGLRWKFDELCSGSLAAEVGVGAVRSFVVSDGSEVRSEKLEAMICRES